MSNLLKVFALIACFGLLTACININFDGNSSDSDKQNETEDQEEQSNVDDKQEPTVDDDEAQEDEEKESNEPEPSNENKEEDEVVLENEAFQIFEPTPDAEVRERVVVRGLARVFEGTLQYEFEDGHFIIDKGFTTASKGAPEWGEFEIIIDLVGVSAGAYRVVLFEESAKDGSIVNELIIPVQVMDD